MFSPAIRPPKKKHEQVFVVFHPPVGGAPSENARANGADPGILTPEEQGSAKSRVLLEAIAAVPANMAMAIGRFLGELNAEAAAAVSGDRDKRE